MFSICNVSADSIWLEIEILKISEREKDRFFIIDTLDRSGIVE